MELQNKRDGWRRRIPLALLVCGMAILVVRHFARQPVEVEVAYHYGGWSSGLQAASFDYQRDGEVVARVRFGYRTRPAEPVQRHIVRLPRGDYTVLIELRYEDPRRAGKAERQLKRARLVDNGGVSLTRRLSVQQEGQVHIYL